MKKNGFTLIELIATIGLLGMLATILITVSVRKVNETKEYARTTMIGSIEFAAQKYVMDFKDDLDDFQSKDYIYITLQTLVEKEYFTKSLIDPTTNKSLPLTDTVYVTRESNGKITATYDINQKNHAKLVLNGSYNEYLKVGETYTDLGINATSSTGADISSSITTTGTVDTSIEGTYKIKYEYNGVSITRNVIVYAGNKPSQSETIPLLNHINGLYNNSTLRTENGLIKDNTKDGNIRYTGSTVKNYVKFNNETWRIVGVFEVTKSNGTKEKLVKIVRDASLGNMSWDSSASTVNNGYGINEWSQADLQTMLNTYYLGTGTTCKYCNGSGQSTCTNDCPSTVTQISSTYTNIIEEVKWNTGAITWASGRVIPVETAYEEERGTTTGKICTSGTYCNDTVERKTEWTGKVGLIYPSDYGYASTDTSCRANIYDYTNVPCKNNNWLHNNATYWTLSPVADSSDARRVWRVSSSGCVDSNYASNALGVRPAVYLKSNIKITGGDGSSSTPYMLSL